MLGRKAKPGQKKPSHTSVFGWLKSVAGDASPVPASKPSASKRRASVGPDDDPIDDDDKPAADDPDAAEMTPQELARWLASELRRQQKAAKQFSAMADDASAMRSTRVAASLAALLAKMHARDGEDRDTIKLQQSDVAAAAERARSKLHDLVARLASERGQ